MLHTHDHGGYKSKCIIHGDQSAADPAEPSKESKGRDLSPISIPATPLPVVYFSTAAPEG